MRHTLPTLYTLLILLFSLGACDSITNEDNTLIVRNLTEDEQRIIHADNTFGIRLYQAIHEDAPEENLFISPLSVSMALGMALNGADGDTRLEMANVLEKSGLSEQAMNESYKSLIELLFRLDNQVTLTLANSIWYREGFQVDDTFLNTNKTFFDAEISSLDFNAPEAKDDINAWVTKQTNGLIDQIIESIDRETLLYLINAIYFKGNWTYQFDPEFTHDAPFNNFNSSQSTVSMMSLRGTFPYYHSDSAAFIELPYGDSLFTMSIVLPHDDKDIDEIVEDLNSNNLPLPDHRLSYTTLDLFIPKFELEFKTSLNGTLQSLGMEKAFLPNQANFNRINAEHELYISEAIHKTFIEISEEGTEAAAVTAIGIGTTSVGEEAYPVFRVDKPFLFFIKEKSTGTILFAGKIMTL